MRLLGLPFPRRRPTSIAVERDGATSTLAGLTSAGVRRGFQENSREEEMTFLLWTFILIGNAAALVVLSSMTAAGTSSMG
jgi:hypothetical protein